MELYYKLAQETDVFKIRDIICEEVSNASVDINVDSAGNIVVHKKGAGKKIMVSAVINYAKLCIKNIKPDNIAEVDLSDKFNLSAICGKEAVRNGESLGIIRCDGHREKSSEKDMSCNIELWDENSIDIGDICYISSKVNYKGDMLYGFNISAVTITKIIISVINNFSETVNDIYFTLSFADFGLVSAVKNINPDVLHCIYEVDANKEIRISNGCGIVYKDGNAIISDDIIKIETENAKNNNIVVQPFVGKQNKLIETLGITGELNDIGAICIPVKHLRSSCEVIDIGDVESAEKLITNILCK